MKNTFEDNSYTDELLRCFEESGDMLDDEELLCLLLSFTNIKKSVTETVQRLKEHFGSAERCFYASFSELVSIDGVTESAARLIKLCSAIPCHRDIPNLIGKTVKDYCKLFLSVIKSRFDEEFWAAALADNGVLINVACISDGGPGAVEVRAADLCRFAAQNASRRIVIAHSHIGSGKAEASMADERALKYIGGVLAGYGVELVGQVIVSGKDAEFYGYTAEDA